MAQSMALTKRASEAEQSLKEAQRIADVKTNEALDALERAGDHAEALKKEKAARIAAENSRKATARDLRLCLRRSVKAEEDALASAKALAKSEAQLESLTQRLDVLRMANQRLEKRLAVASTAAAPTAGGTSTKADVGDKLAAARARLRTLSAGTFSSEAGSGRGTDGDRGGRASVDRAVKASKNEKKWKEKLREAEAKGDMYRSAAQAAETEMQGLVRDNAKMQEVNKILGKRLAELSGKAPLNDSKRNENVELDNPVVSSNDADGGVKVVTAHNIPVCLAAKPEVRTANSTTMNGAIDSGRCTQEQRGCEQLPRCTDTVAIANASFPPPPPAGVLLQDEPQYAQSTKPSRPVVEALSANGSSTRDAATRSVSFDTAMGGNNSPCRRLLNPRPRNRSTGDFSLSPSIPVTSRELTQSSTSAVGDDASVACPSGYSYERLLSESRQVREDALRTVQEGPWRDVDGGGGDAPVVGGPFPVEPAVQSVPIDVLLRLCGRSARGGGTGAEDRIRGILGHRKIAQSDDVGVKHDTDAVNGVGEHDGVEIAHVGVCSDQTSELRTSEESEANDGHPRKLPPGVSAALAEQVWLTNALRWDSTVVA